MFRNDFVSNSSSCSFIIDIKEHDDISHIKRDINGFLNRTCSLLIIEPKEHKVFSLNSRDDCSKLKEGMYIIAMSGENNTLGWERKWRRLCDFVKYNNYKYKIYQDPSAHETIGEERDEK